MPTRQRWKPPRPAHRPSARRNCCATREAGFRRLDANKDGSLTLTEFNAAIVAAPPAKANAAPALSRFDTNKDGRVSLTENRAPAMAEFERADTNKDGILSVEERKRVKR